MKELTILAILIISLLLAAEIAESLGNVYVLLIYSHV